MVLKQQLKTVVYKPHVEASQSEALYLNRQASSFNFTEMWKSGRPDKYRLKYDPALIPT